MKFVAKFFDELTCAELYEIVRARQEIFLMEQNIVCRDFDGVDYDALHCFLLEGGRVIAYLRAYMGDGGEVHIGRVLSITHGMGHGREIMQRAMPVIMERLHCESVTLHSQCHAEGFYKKLGFESVGEIFIEEGIPHIMMKFEF